MVITQNKKLSVSTGRPEVTASIASHSNAIGTYTYTCVFIQDGYLPGKPGKVGEFDIGRGKSGKLWFACGVLLQV